MNKKRKDNHFSEQFTVTEENGKFLIKKNFRKKIKRMRKMKEKQASQFLMLVFLKSFLDEF